LFIFHFQRESKNKQKENRQEEDKNEDAFIDFH